MPEKYNGFTNKATWLVTLFFGEVKDVSQLKEELEELIYDLDLGIQKGFGEGLLREWHLYCYSTVNWEELEEFYKQGEDNE